MSLSVSGMSLGSMGETAALIIAAVIAAGSWWSRHEVSEFLSRHSTIESDDVLTSFKAMVRRQMLGAICLMAFGIVFVLLCMFVTSQLMLAGFIFVLSLAVPMFLFARGSKKVEVRARTLICSDERLQAEYDRVASAWTKKLFPDF
jgi:multisubunit Na+/H+ antiporter MnhG subunit